MPVYAVLKHIRRVALVIAVVAFVLSAFAQFTTVQAATDFELTLGLDGSSPTPPTPVDVGQTLVYRIDYSCNSLTVVCGQLSVTDIIDPNLTIVNVSVASGYTATVTGQTITITNPNFQDGTTSEAVITVRVNQTAPANTIISNSTSGTIQLNNESDTAGPVTVIVKAPNPVGKWQVTKTQSSPKIDPTTDQPVTFQVSLCPTSPVGNEALTGVTMTDTFPAGADIIDPDGGTVDTPTNTITWAIPDAEVQTAYNNNQCVTRNVTMQFNDAAGTPPGTFSYPLSNIQNTAGVTSNEVPSIGPGTVTFKLIAPQPEPHVAKSIAGNPVSITNGLGRFSLHADTSTANISPNTLVLMDNLPAGNALLVTSISSGKWSPSNLQATVSYSLDGTTWTPLGTVDGTANTTWNALPANITNVKWDFGSGTPAGSGIPLGWATGGPEPEVDFKAGTGAVAGTSYSNCMLAIYNGTSSGTSCASADIENDTVNISPSKTVTGNNFAPEDIIPFTLTLNVTERSDPAVPLTDPVIVDQLPPQLTFVNPPAPTFTYDLANCGGGSLPAPTFTDSGGAGSTLTWSWVGSVINPPVSGNCSIVVKFSAQVNTFVTANTYHNVATFTTSQANLHCEKDTDPATAGCQQDAPFDVRATAVLNAQKWIVNPNIVVPPDQTSDAFFYNTSTNTDNDPTCPTYGPDGVAPNVTYTRFPCVAKGYPHNANTNNADANFDYKLVISNTGNVSGSKYFLYDILPHAGDVGVDAALNGSPRASQFAPYLTGPVTIGSSTGVTGGGMTIQYSASYDPCRTEVGEAGTVCDWSATPPGGLYSNAKSFRVVFDAGTQLGAGGVMIFVAPMQIPANAQGGQIAWNSFAHVITSATTNLTLPAAEPRKVGIMVPKRMSLGNRIWLDDGTGGGTAKNGIQDGGELGVANVAVTLYQNNAGNPGAVVATTTTDANGYYLFGDLNPGQYIVGIDAANWNAGGPLDHAISSPGNATNNTDKNDNGVDQANPPATGVLSNVITLTQDSAPTGEADLSGDKIPPHDDGAFSRGTRGETDNNSDLTVDFGFYVPMSIGNRVWLDEGNGNTTFRNDGLRNNGEPGIDGVNLSLYRDNNSDGQPDGAAIATTVTAGNGYYLFDNLIPGNYIVGIDHSNFVGAGKLVNMVSSYPFPAAPFSPLSVLANDDKDHGKDNTTFATAANGLLSNTVQLKLNSEPTGEADLGPQQFGANTEIDKNSDLTIDFGFYAPKMSIGNRVWLDNGNTNPAFGNDNQRDNGERGIASVALSLYNADVAGNPTGAVLKTTTTDANGYYLFDNLTAGKYVVTIDNANFAAGGPLYELNSSTGMTGLDTNNDHDNAPDALNPTYGLISRAVTLALQQQPVVLDQTDLSNDHTPPHDDGPNSIGSQGQFDLDSNLTLDFGFYIPMSLGNRVWLDEGNGNTTLRNDGLRNNGEPGIDGVKLSLYHDNDSNGQPDGAAIATTTTAGGGYYLFDNLAPGNYLVGVDATNFQAGGPLVNMASSYLHPDPAAPFAALSILANDDKDHGIDNTFFATQGIFSNTVTLAQDGEPAGEADHGPINSGSNTEIDKNNDLTIDFGFYIPKMSIGNRVWLDDGGGNPVKGNNMLRDTGEPGIANVALSLYNADAGGNPTTLVKTTTTDPNGYYLFDDLSAGKYVVAIDNSNFGAGNPLFELASSTGINGTDGNNDHDNTTDVPGPFGLVSRPVTLALQQQPVLLDQTDLSNDHTPPHDDGPNSIGNQGQLDFDSNLTLDFGFYPPMSIGNRVWLDDGTGGGTARDSIQNGNEPGIAGVTVKLYVDNGDGTFDTNTDALFKTTTTDANGYYLFDGLVEGKYFVWIDKANFAAGQPLVSDDNSLNATNTNTGDQTDHGVDDNFPAVNGIASKLIDLTRVPNQPTGETDLSNDHTPPHDDGPNSRGTHSETDSDSNLVIDFGFAPTIFSVGNRVWFDINNSGTLDAADGATPGLANVIVNLYTAAPGTCTLGALVKSTTTDPNGYYLFDNLTAGTYIVELDQLSFRTGGPLLNMYSSTGVASFATDNNDSHDRGNDNANPQVGGIHSCDFTLSKNAEPLGEALSNNPADGPNFIGHQGQIDSNSDLIVDFGLYQPMSIGNRVWFDLDGNGAINGAETGVPAVTMELYADVGGVPTGPALQTKLTDANGYYLFDNVPPGSYDVVVAISNFAAGQPLAGLSSSPGADVSTTDSTDKGIDAAAAQGIRSNTVVLALGTEPTNETDFSGNAANDGPSFIGRDGETNNDSNIVVDFGFVSGQMNLGNRVWLDKNNNGVIDTGETGIANVKVSLYLDSNADGVPDGAAIKTTTTDATGHYLFINLTPGDYLVGLDNADFNTGQPLHTLVSSTGATANNDSHDNGIDALNPTYGLLSGTIPMTLNNEPTGETDKGTQPTGGASDQNSNLTVDFGLHHPMAIGNRIWYDTNNDGLQNGTEAGIANVTVALYADANNDGVPDTPGTPLATTTTDANGYYIFGDLAEGHYLVSIQPANFQPGGALLGLNSSPGNATNNTDKNDNGIDNATPATNGILSNTITLTENTEPTGEADHGPQGNGPNGETDNNSNLTVDFGFSGGTLSLGNRVWIDDGTGGGTARDGLRNGGELGVANVQLGLFRDTNADGVPDSATPILTTTTDGTGYYLFDNLAAGEYVVEIMPTNFAAGKPLFGYGSTKTGTVNTDDNDNGIDNTDPTANGILSKTVNLQVGAEPTLEGDKGSKGSGSATDQDSNLTVDFGFYKAMSIGNRVWFDLNDNAVLDAGENGVAGVKVNLIQDTNHDGLFGPGDATLATTTTDSRGYYLFDNLAPDKYFVQVDATNFGAGGVLAGFNSSTGVKGGNVDSTDNGIDNLAPATNGIVSNLISLTPNNQPTGEKDLSGDALQDGPFFRGNQGQSDNNSNLTIDFGFNAPVMSLGNRVWLDNGAGGGVAGNGILDGTEPGVAKVTVGLFADTNHDGVPDGAAIATTLTDKDGYYLFDKLAPGSYVVRVEPSNFQTGGPLFGVVSSVGATAGTDSHDNGIDNGNPGTNGVLSGTIDLVAGTEPLLEPDQGPKGPGSAQDDNSNLTVDFSFNVAFDLGDAPDTYGTTNAANGPKHQIISTLYLGKVIDAEPDGQPNPAANGDDTNGIDDEDGVTVPTFVVGTTQNVEVTVFNNTGKRATLALWVDFGGTIGKFDTGERFAVTVPSSASPQIVQVPVIVPIGADVATGGSTYLRARLSTDAATVSAPTGPAPDGEVEDYVAKVNPPGLAITKTDNQNSIVVGQSATYTISIENSGVDVQNRNVTDNPPTGNPNGFDPATLTWTCVATNGASCKTGQPAGTGATGTGPINQNIDIPRGGTIVYTLKGTLRATYNQPTVTNEADLASGEKSVDVDGVITDPATGVKSGAFVGSNTIHWTMTWTNSGLPQAATVSDPIPAGQSFAGNLTCTPSGTSTTTSCTFAGNTVTWSGTLGTGPANHLEIGFDVHVSGPGSYSNVGSISIGGKSTTAAGSVSNGGGGGGSNNPGLKSPTISKSVDKTLGYPGDIVNWTITVTNPNSVALTNVQVLDNVPDGLIIQSVTTPIGTATTKGQTVTITIPVLSAGQSVAVVVKTEIDPNIKADSIDNIALLLSPYTGAGKATLPIVHELPRTGEHPDDAPSLPISGILGALGLCFVSIEIGRRVRRYR